MRVGACFNERKSGGAGLPGQFVTSPLGEGRGDQDHPKTAQDRSQDQVFIEKGVEKGIEEDSKPGNSRLLGYDGDEARSQYVYIYTHRDRDRER